MLTSVKGETEPQEGVVYKHPSLRVGYVSQHTTHHIGSVLLQSVLLSLTSSRPALGENGHSVYVSLPSSSKRGAQIHYHAVNGVFKMDMIVSQLYPRPHLLIDCIIGEILEKSTRVLSAEEQAALDQDFVGRNGEKRKIEVSRQDIPI